MKIVCVGVPASALGQGDDDVATAAVARGLALGAEANRLLLFGQAAVIGAGMQQRGRDASEDTWLDEAAAWLLLDPAEQGVTAMLEVPPQRPVGGSLDKAIAVVPHRVDTLTLQRSDRVVEMAATLLVMAVPDQAAIDAIDNANLWLVGGPTFSITQHGSRAVVVVGDRVVVVSVVGGEALLQVHGVDGSLAEHLISLQPSSRMSVRSA